MELRDLLVKLDEYDAMPVQTPMPDPKPTMNVNMSAQGDSIKDLLKLLSDIDGGIEGLDRDKDGDHDTDDHEMEAYANEPDEDEQDIDFMVNKLAGGMNRPKKTYDKRSPGDNPMQKISDDDLVEHFRTQLAQRLAEYKGN